MRREGKTPDDARTPRLPAPLVRQKLLAWWRKSGRQFFWREADVSPYIILITEILLSKSQAHRVEVVAQSLLKRWPTARALSGARVGDLQEVLFPLGLQKKRASLLTSCAHDVTRQHAGEVPADYESLVALPYVGHYTARAVQCFAFGQAVAVLDANIARVYCRLLGEDQPRDLRRAPSLAGLAAEMVAPRRPREFNWALLDLGGTVCKPRRPACAKCPLSSICATRRAGHLP